ncbi:uncharacterized protein LOC9631549 [Selaginella moellendorffii]|uniref:uncharacterized protein LOC9631549 n=1 Tax=Selaginella moellendorffii TaxID=88036 RepID=UPI000D1C562E|nr:uncharacterized protein LOC9631549 [Selaginella moellendorffii]|eukprot:XP_024520044.1 uncharacterized protein LOC9631549 [Selaginella moellendorffii]
MALAQMQMPLMRLGGSKPAGRNRRSSKISNPKKVAKEELVTVLHFPRKPMEEEIEKESSTASSDRYSYLSDGKLDKFHRLRSPRAARELSLCVLYAGLVSGSDPLEVLEDRMQARRERVDEKVLDQYDHDAKSGEPLYVSCESEAKELEFQQEQQSEIDAALLTAHPCVVYNKFVLSLAEKIIKATSEGREKQEAVVKELLPSTWKDESNGKLLETTIMHMAIAEIEVLGTSPNIVINEAVELAKRFCDGFAPRVVNGCLGNYFRSRQPRRNMSPVAKGLQASSSASLYESIGWKDEYDD